MNKSLLSLPLLIALASPALATGGMTCRTGGAHPIAVSLVIGHTAVPAIVSARLSDNDRNIPATVAQSWLEPNELRLDLVDRNAMHREARLLAKKNGRSYDGSIWRGGKRRWIRCRES